MAKNKVLICPYCGQTQPAGERCRACGGLFEPLSRQATHNAMGPWFLRDAQRPFQPGCSYETLIQLIERGQVNKYSIIRGPTTRQFWTVARRVPGVAHLLGYCHSCDASVDPGDHGCHACGVPFGAYLDRNFMGLPEVQPLPWEPGIEPTPDASGLRQPRLGWSPHGGPAAGAGRISSFAHDEDLAAPAVGGDDARSILGRQDPAASAVAVVTDPGTHPGEAWGETTLEELPTGYASRAMQRRLATQRRSIRILAALLVVTGLVALSVLAVLASRSVGLGPSDAQPSPAPSSGEPDPLPAQPEAAAAAPAPAPMELEELLDAPSEEPPPVVEDDRDDEAYQRALELLESARQTDRAAADRVGDYEQALEILEGLAAEAPPKQQPADLAELIEQARRELERLKLQEFFP